ncbi:MAG: hypothetical protein WC467_01890 [Patescibacteria group bacterium]
MKETTKNGSGAMKLLILGASVAGLAAAYFFLGPKKKKNLEDAKSWAIKMKGDVIEKIEQAREVSEPIYNDIIDSVAAKYEKEMKSTPQEIKALAQNLKTHWRAIDRAAKAKKITTSKVTPKQSKIKKLVK